MLVEGSDEGETVAEEGDDDSGEVVQEFVEGFGGEGTVLVVQGDAGGLCITRSVNDGDGTCAWRTLDIKMYSPPRRLKGLESKWYMMGTGMSVCWRM